MKKLCLFICVLCFVSLAWSQVENTKQQKPSPGLPQRQVVSGVAAKQTLLPLPPERRLPLEYGKLPMSFEANQGQTGSPVKFLARGPGYAFSFSSSEAVLMLRKPANEQTRLMQGLAKPGTLWLDAAIVRVKLLRGNPSPAIDGQDELPGKSNYFIGS